MSRVLDNMVGKCCVSSNVCFKDTVSFFKDVALRRFGTINCEVMYTKCMPGFVYETYNVLLGPLLLINKRRRLNKHHRMDKPNLLFMISSS